MGLVEEQAEAGEDHPELLPAVAVLELPQQVPRQLVLHGSQHNTEGLGEVTRYMAVQSQRL